MAGETCQLIYRVQRGRELLARHGSTGIIAVIRAIRGHDAGRDLEDIVSVVSALHADRCVSTLRRLARFKAEPDRPSRLPKALSLLGDLATQALSLLPKEELERAAA